MRRALLICVAAIAALAPTSWANTIYVNGASGDDAWDGRCEVWDGGTCGPKLTIQAGLNAAAGGDEILVADGVYGGTGNRDLDAAGKAISMRSTNGPYRCTIDCTGAAVPAFRFDSGETTSTVVAGFTIVGAQPAILCVGAGPTVRGCVLRDGKRALKCTDGSPRFENCLLRANESDAYDGGAVYSEGSGTCTLVNCTLAGNAALRDGGAVATHASVVLENCIFWENYAPGLGQQICARGSSAQVSVAYSDVPGGAAGVALVEGAVLVWNAGNIDADPHFALPEDVHLEATSPCVDTGTNVPAAGLPPNDLDGNARPLDGDGDTIATADMGGFEYNPATPCLASSPGEVQLYTYEGDQNPPSTALAIRNCGGGVLSWGVTSPCDWLSPVPASGVSAGEVVYSDLTVDPSDLAAGTYHCVLTVADPLAFASPRLVQVTLVVGVLRRVPSEYTTIQAAIDAASTGDQVLVADGVYAGPGNRSIAIRGKTISVRSEHGPTACVIDCQKGGRGFLLDGPLSPDTVVEGFTITDGSEISGGGVYCVDRANATLRNCIIRNCWGHAEGVGGAGVSVQLAAPLLVDCVISDNATNTSGGGIGLWGNHARRYIPKFVHCTITGNSADVAGGGVAIIGSMWAEFDNCICDGSAAPAGPQLSISGSGHLAMSYDDVEGGQAAIEVGPYASLDWGAGNIDIDPLFAVHGDYHLGADSPCVDAGGNGYALVQEDVDGNPRVLDGDGDGVLITDMGADEYDAQQPCLGLAPSVQVFAGWDGANPDPQALRIRNTGGGALAWQIDESCDWLTVTPANGSSAGELDEVTVDVTTIGMAPGDYSCALLVTAASAGAPRLVLVHLHVGHAVLVPGEYATIQAALDAAVAGDAVIVADGVYTGVGNRALTFRGKAILLRSANGPANCIIDCEQAGRAVELYSGEGPSTVIAGLTIRNGRADNGGAISCIGSSPTIADCTVEDSISLSRGGGLYLESSDAVIRDCRILRNEAASEGGGIACRVGGQPVIACTVIRGNTAEYGGGLCSVHAVAGVSATVFANNTAYTHGGGWFNEFADADLTNCVLVGNVADDDGGAVYSRGGGDLLIRHATVAGNRAARGGGLYLEDTETALWNSTVRGNEATYGSQLAVVAGDSGSPCDPTVSYCDVEGGQSAVFLDAPCTLNWGAGNVDADPAFAFGDDFHLMPGSPCIDTGTNSPPGGLPADDLEGCLRPVDGDGDGTAAADMGAYEHALTPPAIAISPSEVEVFIPEGVSDPDDIPSFVRNAGGGTLRWECTPGCAWLVAVPPSGESVGEVDPLVLRPQTGALEPGVYECGVTVSDPLAVNSPRTLRVRAHVFATLNVPGDYATIQAAIDAAVNDAMIVVSDGVYSGAGNTNLDLHGKTITVRSESGAANCTIDCAGNSRAFYLHTNEPEQATVKGFTIINGRSSQGGGITLSNSSRATIRDCVIQQCTADSNGGGIALFSRATVQDCVITQCSSPDGGGIQVSTAVEPTIQRCTISLNSAGRGGGIECANSNCRPRILDCTVTQNSSSLHGGGGIYCADGAGPRIRRCVLCENTAVAYGGAIYVNSAAPQVAQCTIEGNQAMDGGAIYTEEMNWTRGAVLTTSIISGNIATRDGGGVLLSNTALVCLANTQIDNNEAGRDGGGIYSGSGTGRLANCTIACNNAVGKGGGLYSRPGGTLSNDILWHNTAGQGHEIALVCSTAATLTVTYSDVEDGAAGVFIQGPGTLVWGEGSIMEDPLLPGCRGQVYRPAPGSPCVNAGRNADIPPDVADLNDNQDTSEPTPFDVEGLARLYDDIVDMGAFEFPLVLGDLNCDGRADNFDISPFVLALTATPPDYPEYYAQFPSCDRNLGDINGDGRVDNFDITPFVRLLTGG